MKKTAILAAFVIAGLLWFVGTPAQALTIDELADLCKAGYSTAEILQFVETLGLDDPLDSDALVRLKEEGCSSELAVELMQIYGEEEEESDSWGAEPSSRVYVYAGWDYPYYWNSWWADWYSPWWGGHAGWYDPWSWDYGYWPHSYYYHAYSHWGWWPYTNYYWHGDRHRQWCRSDYRYVTAHQKGYRTRPGLVTRAKTDAESGGYRTRVSRAVVEKSYKSRAGYAARVSAMDKSDAIRSSKSEYQVKGKSTAKSAITSSRSGKRSSTPTQGGTYRRSEPSKATPKGTAKSRSSSGAVKRSAPVDRTTGQSPSYRSTRSGAHPKSSTGTHRSTPPATSSGKSGSYSAPPPSSGSSSSSAPSSSGTPHPRRR